VGCEDHSGASVQVFAVPVPGQLSGAAASKANRMPVDETV